jgi:hypothetical protein
MCHVVPHTQRFHKASPFQLPSAPPALTKPRDRKDPDHTRTNRAAKAPSYTITAVQGIASAVPPADEECAGDSEKYPLRSPSALGRARGMRSAVPPARVADSGQRRWHGAKRHPHTLAGSDRKCQILVDTGRMMINIAPFDTSGVADTSESCPSERSTRKRRGPDGPRSAIRDPPRWFQGRELGSGQGVPSLPCTSPSGSPPSRPAGPPRCPAGNAR